MLAIRAQSCYQVLTAGRFATDVGRFALFR